MNGRCETDWIDHAVDVCDRCYGEFCSTCLMELPGRKHPLCLDCALTRSGARQSRSRKPARGAKASAKKRRKELKERNVLVPTEDQPGLPLPANPKTPSIADIAILTPAPTAINKLSSVESSKKVFPATRQDNDLLNEVLGDIDNAPKQSTAAAQLAKVQHSRATEPQDLDLLRGRIQHALTTPELSKPPRPLSRAERSATKPSDNNRAETLTEINSQQPDSVAVRGDGPDTAPFVGVVRYVNVRPKENVGAN